MTPWWVSLLISLGMAIGAAMLAMWRQAAVLDIRLQAQEDSYTAANLALEKLFAQRFTAIEQSTAVGAADL